MTFTWKDLNFWNSGEWQVIEENLDDLETSKTMYCPRRKDMFRSLDLCPFENTVVAVIGQDPYPKQSHATGIAFSIPKEEKKYPPTLVNILKEYTTDLGYPEPKTGDLSVWCNRGVLLWNTVPSCLVGQPGSHRHWPEWPFLTEEIVKRLSDKGVVFALLGSQAHALSKLIDPDRNGIVMTSHPSRLGATKSFNPFLGSRLFSTINDKLIGEGHEPIDWKLPS